MEVDGLHTIYPLFYGFPGKLNRGFLGWSSCYLIKTDPLNESQPKLILYDTGGFNERGRLIQLLSEMDIHTNDIDAIILSHLHFDHAVNWPLFANAEIYLHYNEVYFPNTYTDHARLDFHDEKLRVHPKTNFVQEGDQIYGMKVVELPGHTPGLIGLHVSDRMLVSDAVKNRIELEKGALYNVWDKDIANQSIEKIKQLTTFIYPGHDVPLVKEKNSWSALTEYHEEIQLSPGFKDYRDSSKIQLTFIESKKER